MIELSRERVVIPSPGSPTNSVELPANPSHPFAIHASASQPTMRNFYAIAFAFACAWTSAVSLPCAIAQLPAPELNVLNKMGAQIGQPPPALDAAIGNQLAGAHAVYSHLGLTAAAIPADTQPGIYSLRAMSDLGLSNSRSFWVSADPWEVVASNEVVSNAVPIAMGTRYQDECPDRGINYYRIQFETDQAIMLRCYAYSLDSRARLVLSIKNSDGNTVATMDASNEHDPSLIFQAKGNVPYIITVHDHLFRGGPEFRYALQMTSPTSMPAVQSDPLALVAHWQYLAQSVQNLNQSTNVSPGSFDDWQPRIAFLRPPCDASPLLHDESLTPNPSPIRVSLPAIVAGRFERNDDVDLIEVECEANTDVVAEVVSQRAGQPTDSALTVYRVENPGQPNEKQTKLTENDDFPATGNAEMRFGIKDSYVFFRSPEKSIYRIAVRDQQRTNRDRNQPTYALEIRIARPGFLLASHYAHPIREPEQTRATNSTISTFGAKMLSVHALRFDGFAGPIELQVAGLPTDIRGGSGILASDQNHAVINLWNASNDASAPNTVHALSVTGSAKLGELTLSSLATPLEIRWNSSDTYRSPIGKLASPLTLTKSSLSTCPVSVELGPVSEMPTDPIIMDAVRGQPLKIPVRVVRRPGGETAGTIRMHHTATKTTAAEIKLEPNVAEGTLEVQIPKDAPVGEYLFGALCEAAVTVPNPDPAAAEKNLKHTLQIPSSNVRLRIGDAPQ